MKVHEVELGNEHDSYYILPLSDLHVGDLHFNERKFIGYRDWILNNQNAYCFLNGDILNTALKDSKSDVYSSMPPGKEIEKAINLLLPIRDRILTSVAGNHERRHYISTGIDLSEILAYKLGCHYSGDETVLKIKCGKGNNNKPIVYTLYATHGHAGGRTIGAKANHLNNLSNIILTDIYVMSHIHTMSAHQGVMAVPDIRNNKVDYVKQTFVSSGAYLDRGGYAISHGYPHVKLGSPRIRLDGRKKDTHVSL